MKDNRPVNLDIGTIRLPITAYASILHRVSGVIMVVASFLLLWALDLSLSGPEGFAGLGELFGSPLVKFVLWGIATALLYHSFAGVKHLIMDFGIGETMDGGVLGARLVFVCTAVSAVLVGVALW
ncbi:succinate dehydrogenase, cytochrome b556 subunit [Congregibacter sp.]|uniref:succinate dehydrogenase, cytochrome b556 subunit n=1 Tax=Congregibacter sp. TaxID=2744308 RepID=UPI00385CC73C